MTAATPTVSLPPRQVWMLAIRPRTLPAALSPIIVGLAFAIQAGEGSIPIALVTVAVSLLLQIAANLANDLSDYSRGADVHRLGPPRVTQLGLVSPGAMRKAIGVVLAAAVLLGLLLVVHGGWPIALAGVASLLAALAYTGGPYPLAYHGLGEAAVALFFGGVGVLGTVYLQLDEIPAAAWAAAAGVAALAAMILVVNNLRDLATDAAAGKRTLAVRLGERGTVIEYRLLLAVAFGMPILMTIIDRSHIGWLAVWLIAPRAWSLSQRVATTRGPALNPVLGTTAKLGLWYAIALAGGIILERWL